MSRWRWSGRDPIRLISRLRRRVVSPPSETEYVVCRFVLGSPPQWIVERYEGWHRRADLATMADEDGEFRRGGGGYVSDTLSAWVVKAGRVERREDGVVGEVWELYW